MTSDIRVNIRTGTSTRAPQWAPQYRAPQYRAPQWAPQWDPQYRAPQPRIPNNFEDQTYPLIFIFSVIEEEQPNSELQRNPEIKLDLVPKKYKEQKLGPDECAICQVKFRNGNKVSSLSCGHIFHESCIQEWGKYKQECPLCRAKIPILER